MSFRRLSHTHLHGLQNLPDHRTEFFEIGVLKTVRAMADDSNSKGQRRFRR